MNIFSHQHRNPAEERLRERIFCVLPAGSFQMDRLLQLVDIIESDLTPTACIECGPLPRLHLNPAFVDEFCRCDEHLFMLVMHELYHVVLGHSRLFPRPTWLHNIAFDAVINAMLCNQFPEQIYLGFFQALNSWESFPSRLLRPPPGWPRKDWPWPENVSEAERRIITLLYNSATSATYWEIFDLLVSALREAQSEKVDPTNCVLLGDHSGPEGKGVEDAAAVEDAQLREVLGGVVRDWPGPANPITVRGGGAGPYDFLLPKGPSPRQAFLSKLNELLRIAGILGPPGRESRAWRRLTCEREIQTVLPQWRDRRVAALIRLTGRAPTLYQATVADSRQSRDPSRVAHVYFDISGSMSSVLPLVARALQEPHRRGELQLYVFSTVVDTVKPRVPLTAQKLKNTGGTDINCVLQHLFELPPRRTPRKVVLLTDGYTGLPKADLLPSIRARQIKFYVGLIRSNACGDLHRIATHITPLPQLSPELL